MKMSEQYDIVVGVDNGLDGGLCALSAHSGAIIDYLVMPCCKRQGKREVDVMEFLAWVNALESRTLLALEEPLKHAKSSEAMRSMSITFGQIYGACRAKGVPVEPIQVGDWQRVILGKRGSFADTKKQALKIASGIWPDETWIPTKRHRTPHDGIVDAALIAWHVFRR